MAGSYDGLRKVLALERDKKFSDSAVVGGLDEYLLRFTTEAKIGSKTQLTYGTACRQPDGSWEIKS